MHLIGGIEWRGLDDMHPIDMSGTGECAQAAFLTLIH